jgi:uncharacterized protein (DUF58 family)
MIVPRERLLFWVAVVVLPFALLGAIEPVALPVSVAAIATLIALALVDALRAPSSLAGIGVVLPELARMSKDRPGKIEVQIRNERQRARTLRLALALPRQIESSQEDALIALPPQSEWSRLAWPCVPRERGTYRLENACLEARSPFGFWSARKTVPARAELRVYPNLSAERRDLAALFLHRGAFGLHAQRQVGKGRDFEKLREYIPGDSFDEIHWKATARRGRPITKVFQIERTQELYVVIDASRLAARKCGVRNAECGIGKGAASSAIPQSAIRNPQSPDLQPSTALERFITAALVLGLAAEQQGDLFGLLTFSDKVETFVRAKNGKAHYSLCRDALYTLQQRIVTPDFDELCTFIRLRLRRRALLVFLTALDDAVLAESFVRNMDLIRRQHLVLVNMLQPPGVSPVFSNPNIASVDDLYAHLGGHLLWRNLRELEKVLHRRGVRFSLLKNERLSADLVSQYLNVKRRQLL